jgi:ATP-dependent Lon protease
MSKFAIPPEALRWQPDDETVTESTTRSVQKLSGNLGQSQAREALRLGLTSDGATQHVYLRGAVGTGRRSMIDHSISELDLAPRRSVDFCYVHNFSNPDRPRLIMLPGGQGHQFQQAMSRISLFVRDRLPEILKNDPIRSRREARKESAEREIRLKTSPLDKKLAKDGLALIRTQSGPSSRVSIYPLVMGKPVSPEEYRNLVTQGQARASDREAALKRVRDWQGEVNRVAHEINQIWQQALQHIDQINATETARILGELTAEVGRRFKSPGMDIFLREIIDDIVEKRIGRDTSHLAEPTLLYGANVLTSRLDRKSMPVIRATQPSVANLFGTIDPAWMSSGRAVTSFRGIRTGALLEADGGILVLDAADVRAEPGCWRMLMRSLRTGMAEVVPPELGWPYSAQSLKPEPIPVNVRVVLIGDQTTWDELCRSDRDFVHLFDVLADFDETLPRDPEHIKGYTRHLATQIDREGLNAFDRSGMQELIEYGARSAGEPGRLSARFGDINALTREASDLAREDGAETVERDHVRQALKQRHKRAGLPLQRRLRAADQGLFDLSLSGHIEGRTTSIQRSVSGTLEIGLPIVVHATVAAADRCEIRSSGDVDAHGLNVMLGHLLRLNEPSRLTAVIDHEPALEDSDRGLELARVLSLLSALAQVPLRREVAAVGQVRAHGQIGPVTAINERVETFHELCRRQGLTGQQAIVIPRANRTELMLDPAVVKACRNDMFQVFAVESVIQALELASGRRAGVWRDGTFPEQSLLARARERLTSWNAG